MARKVSVQLIASGNGDNTSWFKGDLVKDCRRYIVVAKESGKHIKVPWSRIHLMEEA